MIDRKLEAERKVYKKIKAPDSMEEELREALERARPARTLKFGRVILLVFVVLVISAANSDSLGEYLRGRSFDEMITREYEDLMPENLRRLRAEGMVQDISRELVLGARKIYVDGIIVGPLGVNVLVRGDRSSFNSLKLVDRNTNKELHGSSVGRESSSGEIYSYYFKGRLEGDSLGLSFSKNGLEESIDIRLDKNLGLSELEKLDINKNISYNNLNYRLKKIYISPIAIEIDGYNETILETGLRTIFNRRKDYGELVIDLIINGRSFSPSEAEFKTDYSGKNFNYLYRDIPAEIDSLELEVIGPDGVLDRIRIK